MMPSFSALKHGITEYIVKRNAIVDGICNIIVANKCSYYEAERILDFVKDELKSKYTFAKLNKAGEGK